MHALQQVFEDADFIVRGYSGRGMYGKTCLGVVTENLAELIAALIEGTNDDERKEVAEAIRTMQMDSFGRDTIVYFPKIQFQEDEFIEGEDEEDR